MIFATTRRVFAAIGVAMLIGALAMRSHTASFVSRAARTSGTVTALVRQRSTDNNISYRPVVRFQAGEQPIVFSSSIASNPPAYSVGETVEVLYLESDPYGAKIDSFRSLWFLPTLLGAMGAIFFAIGGGLIFVPALEQRTDERLVHAGRPVEADFQGVSPNSAIEVNGRCPYRVTAQWVDPSTSRVRLFQSHNVWFDPTAYIKDKKIRVFLDMRDPEKYYVDLSFLPRLAS
jgi:Protein of unknown function (DUF3592)